MLVSNEENAGFPTEDPNANSDVLEEVVVTAEPIAVPQTEWDAAGVTEAEWEEMTIAAQGGITSGGSNLVAGLESDDDLLGALGCYGVGGQW